MRERLKVDKTIVPYEYLKQMYTSCSDAKLKIRLLAILHFWGGLNTLEVAERLKMSDFAVRNYLKRFNKFGLEGLNDLPKYVSQSKLTNEQLNSIDEAFGKSPRESGLDYNNWSIPLLAQWIEEQFGIHYSESNVYKIVEKLNYSRIRPRKRDKRVNQQILDDFKEKFMDTLASKTEDTVILYEDEAIITSEPTTTAIWAKRGSRPIVKTDTSKKRDRKVIFGAVNPESGQLVSQISDSGNSEYFESFLK